jgi:2-polyprenyl-3-methyl-5-hydroxy-6-metoxy-1,4-benzoquinol methylase
MSKSAKEWDELARRYDELFSVHLDIIDDEIIGHTDFLDKDVLDIGAGTGRLGMKISKWARKVDLVEPSIEMIKEIRKKSPSKKIKIINSTAESISPRNKYDIIIMTEVFHHIRNPRIISQLMNNLRAQGILILVEPIYVNPIKLSSRILSNFSKYGLKRGFCFLKAFINPRAMNHLMKDRYYTKEELDSLAQNHVVLEKRTINDSFYMIKVQR